MNLGTFQLGRRSRPWDLIESPDFLIDIMWVKRTSQNQTQLGQVNVGSVFKYVASLQSLYPCNNMYRHSRTKSSNFMCNIVRISSIYDTLWYSLSKELSFSSNLLNNTNPPSLLQSPRLKSAVILLHFFDWKNWTSCAWFIDKLLLFLGLY